MFPSRVPVRALEFPEWDLRFVLQDRDVQRLVGKSIQRARIELMRVPHKRLRLVRVVHPVPSCSCLDTWVYSSYSESFYGANLIRCDFDGWRVSWMVDNYAMLFELHILPADLGCHMKSCSPEYVDYIKWDSLARSRCGFLFPYHYI